MTESHARTADALAAEGTTIILADGTSAQLVYTMDSMRALEREFGSLTGLMAAAQTIQDGLTAETARGARGAFETIVVFIAAGLRKHPVWDDDGRRVRLGRDLDLTAEALDLKHLTTYVKAFTDALTQALGAGPTVPPVTLPEQPTDAPLTVRPPSPGPSGGISAFTSPTSPPVSSGA